MKPIQDIINRIKWDPHYGKGSFMIGYYDRLEDRILLVPFKDIHFVKENHFLFEIEDSRGEIHTIPYHRVRQVYKNSALIWERKRGSPG